MILSELMRQAGRLLAQCAMLAAAQSGPNLFASFAVCATSKQYTCMYIASRCYYDYASDGMGRRELCFYFGGERVYTRKMFGRYFIQMVSHCIERFFFALSAVRFSG